MRSRLYPCHWAALLASRLPRPLPPPQPARNLRDIGVLLGSALRVPGAKLAAALKGAAGAGAAGAASSGADEEGELIHPPGQGTAGWLGAEGSHQGGDGGGGGLGHAWGETSLRGSSDGHTLALASIAGTIIDGGGGSGGVWEGPRAGGGAASGRLLAEDAGSSEADSDDSE